MEFRSFAKVNIGLEITGKRANGYHELRTIFQTISLYDTIEINENQRDEVSLSGDSNNILWDKSNTIIRAFELMYDKFGLNKGFDIHVKKNIPAGSGLGGGSSNAAIMMMFIMDYFKLEIPIEELTNLGRTIGAD
ncbi:MAG: 4-(cytidine 5'-diphospho)-2-C-methyl-D-erythritol kinase, partial [Candidatus Aminicenantes bacterium]|nr:4-(cytidine 5'-diphospho)-2-C-methyl-D-erythritol kinase [Candidatus Aminicenantes bacterium]